MSNQRFRVCSTVSRSSFVAFEHHVWPPWPTYDLAHRPHRNLPVLGVDQHDLEVGIDPSRCPWWVVVVDTGDGQREGLAQSVAGDDPATPTGLDRVVKLLGHRRSREEPDGKVGSRSSAGRLHSMFTMAPAPSSPTAWCRRTWSHVPCTLKARSITPVPPARSGPSTLPTALEVEQG